MEKINVTKEIIDAFLAGNNPMERIIKMEIGYDEDKIHIFYRDEKGVKRVTNEPYYPFLWSRQVAARNLFNGNRKEIKRKLDEYGIDCKGLRVEDNDGNTHERMANGYRVLFFAKNPMSFSKFMSFFREGGRPVYPKQNDKNYGLRDYIVVAPNEQHMIMTGKRLFKGYEDYNDLIRLLWDLETEGLDPLKDMITKIGIRTNKGFEKILKVDSKVKETRSEQEITAIGDLVQIIKDIDPDVMSGHNSENFDWNFTDVRLQQHGSSLVDFTAPYFNGKGIYKKKKQQVLKLGGEQEYFFPTIKYGTNLTDSLHAVRRAQAIDSNMEKADLKYITKYSNLNKVNRVYVPGNLIYKTDIDTERNYAHNDKNGKWFKIKWEEVETDSFDEFDPFNTSKDDTPKRYKLIENNTKIVDTKNDEIFDIVTGAYIVDRYLLDDLYETDKVELRYNQPNFLVGKMLPVAFDKMCTMGTAAIWKYIMLAWSYEHNLAIPELIETRKFTGGLSRLLSVGYVDRIVKLDYNSLYPSIILSYLIESPIDISGAMNAFLEYILTQRERYKELKGQFEKKVEKASKELKTLIEENADADTIAQKQQEIQLYDAEVNKYDKLQLPLKITGNGFFGSYGSGSVFPHSDLTCAEMTTCIGRMCLRLMIYHFTNIGYKPIVGDSFTSDTPLFIKYNDNGLIDIKPISELINEKEINIDILNREYDYSAKSYKVLCRSGWVEPSYIYRHKCDKDIYRIVENNMLVDVTEDHSLFNDKQEKVTPSSINTNTNLEYYNQNISNSFRPKRFKEIIDLRNKTIENGYKEIPIEILNADRITKKVFAKLLSYKGNEKLRFTLDKFSKTFIAGYNFINQ